MKAGHKAALVLVPLVAAVAVYAAKDHVRRLDRELVRIESRIEATKRGIAEARATLAYLVRPSRLALQAPQLGLAPSGTGRIVSLDQITHRHRVARAGTSVEAELPSGEPMTIRLKPLAVALVPGLKEQRR